MYHRPDCLLTYVEFLQTFRKRTQRIPTGFYGTPRNFQIRNCSPEASRTSRNPALTVYETDASGNYVNAFNVPLVTNGKSQHQAEAIIGDAVADVVCYAREAGKPIVIEELDFRRKKAALEGESRRYSRMLSSFSYSKVKAYCLSRGYREGAEINQVHPAFSSVVGWVKFM